MNSFHPLYYANLQHFLLLPYGYTAGKSLILPKISILPKTILITGSTSGIGLGIAKAFAAQGYNIAFNGLEPNGAEIAQQVADEFKVQHSFSPANLMQPEAIRNMVADAIKTFGTIDVLVNNAGIQYVAPIDEFPDEKWD